MITRDEMGQFKTDCRVRKYCPTIILFGKNCFPFHFIQATQRLFQNDSDYYPHENAKQDF